MFGRKKVDLLEEMPVLARHRGEWQGEYVHLNPDGKVIDRHTSHLICSFPSDGKFPFYQVNLYSWEDGKKEELHLGATYRDGRIWWDTDSIKGCGWELDARTLVLTWVRKDMPDSYLYEMIHIGRDNKTRSRTWHMFQNDKLIQRTVINETRVK